MQFEKETLQALGLGDFGLISTADIVFGDEIRAICAGNACRRYGTTWACPPAVGTVEECKARCLQFEHALVFNKYYQLEDSFDWEGMMRAAKEFKLACDRLQDYIQGKLPRYHLLSNESCSRCEKCTYPDAPCRFPERLMPTVEGYGIYVNKLAESAGLEYINGPDTVTYFGMLLF